jgi:hypothetical protein
MLRRPMAANCVNLLEPTDGIILHPTGSFSDTDDCSFTWQSECTVGFNLGTKLKIF